MFICYAGFVSSTFVPDNEGFTLDELDSLTPDEPAAHGDPDVLGYSQLGGAPLGISQQQTPQPLARLRMFSPTPRAMSVPSRGLRGSDALGVVRYI